MRSYFKNGLLNDVEFDIDDPNDGTENRSLWTVQCYYLWNMLTESQRKEFPDIASCMESYEVYRAVKTLFDGEKWHPQPDNTKLVEEGMSRDNLIAISGLGLCEYNKDIASQTRVMRESGFSDFHNLLRAPQLQDLIFFGLCAKKWWAKPLKWFLMLNMKWSCSNMKIAPNGQLSTDGKLLSFVRLHSLQDWKTFNEYSLLVYKSLEKYFYLHPEYNPFKNRWIRFPEEKDAVKVWKWVFAMYFKEPTNPINRLCGVIFN